MKAVFFAAVLVMIGALSVSAVEMKSTPVQNAMQAGFALNTTLAGPTLDKPSIFDGSSKSVETAAVEEGHGRKSARVAAMYSLLLPGLGEHYVGQKKKARYFFAGEAMSWIAYIGFRTYSNWKEDDYIRIAREHAGIDLEGRDEEIIDYVGFYDDIYVYNELGRALDRERPYLADNAANHWSWDSDAAKALFRHTKNRAKEFDRRADFTIGVMVLLRIVSVIDAIHAANHSGRRMDDLVDSDNNKLEYRVDAGPVGNNLQVGLTLVKKF
ncbi:MAG TPA: DUF5683 domain-containing protein [candidate division Zixibacteria bacterium]|nr:DUF5683 domain-containing protein [candidate division Zixibacteria bacterium]